MYINDTDRANLHSTNTGWGSSQRTRDPGGVLSPAGKGMGKGVRRALIALQPVIGLHWCWQRGSGFYDHGTVFADPCVWGEMGSTSLTRAKIFLPVGYLTS